MNEQTVTTRRPETASHESDQVYYSLSSFVSFVAFVGLTLTYLWSTSTLVSLTTLVLACQFLLLRFIEHYKCLYSSSPIKRNLSITLDQLFLGLITFAGGSALLLLPLSSVLIFASRFFGRPYLWVGIGTAFTMLSTTLHLALQLELLQALLLSVLALIPPALVSIRRYGASKEDKQDQKELPTLPQLQEEPAEQTESTAEL
ncbi:MAG: hypothetical protein ABW119_20430, partial [Candidatus Thiodiazotropha lotti]